MYFDNYNEITETKDISDKLSNLFEIPDINQLRKESHKYHIDNLDTERVKYLSRTAVDLLIAMMEDSAKKGLKSASASVRFRQHDIKLLTHVRTNVENKFIDKGYSITSKINYSYKNTRELPGEEWAKMFKEASNLYSHMSSSVEKSSKIGETVRGWTRNYEEPYIDGGDLEFRVYWY